MGFKHKNLISLRNLLQGAVDLLVEKVNADSDFKGNTFSTMKETQFIFLWKNSAARRYSFSISL